MHVGMAGLEAGAARSRLTVLRRKCSLLGLVLSFAPLLSMRHIDFSPSLYFQLDSLSFGPLQTHDHPPYIFYPGHVMLF